MARRPETAPPETDEVRILDGRFRLVVVLGAVLLVAMVARLVLTPGDESGTGTGSWTAGPPAPTASATAPGSATPVDLAAYLYPTPGPAPAIELTDSNDRAFALAALRGEPVLVFFGYTHCPDVCPATIGAVGLAMDAFGPGVRAVFVSVDPERDTTAWLREYVRFLPAGFVALTGSLDTVKSTADAWGVKYAKVETGDPDAYAMAHTAEVYLVDADGVLRAHFPFGTESEVMTAVLRAVVAVPAPAAAAPSATSSAPASAPATSSPPAASASPTASIDVDVVSTSLWSGPPGPIILDLLAGGTRLDDPSLQPMVQLLAPTGEAIGEPVTATPVQPPGVATVSYVATLPIPTPGPWQIQVTVTWDGTTLTGTAAVTALDPGATAALGAPAPGVRTPTLDDVGDVVRAVTTDPAPDLRLSRRSTVDALADGQPFALVIDSNKFRVSPACGRAIIMARYLLDRWRQVAFIHLEPYRYQVITATPVLDGTLDDPKLTDPAEAWGIGGSPWGPASMPWVFVVDGDGLVRAKYQGVMGSTDVDVILALIEQGG